MRKWGPPGTGVVLCFMVVVKQLLAGGFHLATLLSLVHRFQLLFLLLSFGLWASPRGRVRFSGTCRRQIPSVGWAFRAETLGAAPRPNSPSSSGPDAGCQRQGLGTRHRHQHCCYPEGRVFLRAGGLWDWMRGLGWPEHHCP